MIFALLMFLLPLAYSPGPGNLYFAAAGAQFGARATVAASVGYHLATWGVTLAIGLGSLATLAQHPAIFAAVKLLGGGYILWIAWRFARSSRLRHRHTATDVRFVDGVVLLLFNPKAYVIIALMFSQFLDPARLPAVGPGHIGQVLLITTVFTLNNLLAFTIWTLAGDRLARVFSSPAQARCLNTGFAVTLAGVGLWMLLD
ncbi:LysE family translocator [Epibacterium sp. Ofav1-8]|uniref:LysE family translocator n=1 Tax=Epibacterium sp. Ofav1-8 TaxID=2917735 RepID=UPI001EF4E5B4|nr:LysE family translocator [Epibacterium sp. Ofav1-8]MCG7623937.1 LysE family translocator [Epibacterium sp. Ofav1-8]